MVNWLDLGRDTVRELAVLGSSAFPPGPRGWSSAGLAPRPSTAPLFYCPPLPPQVPTWLANGITERWYMQALLRRLRRYTANHGLVPPGS